MGDNESPPSIYIPSQHILDSPRSSTSSNSNPARPLLTSFTSPPPSPPLSPIRPRTFPFFMRKPPCHIHQYAAGAIKRFLSFILVLTIFLTSLTIFKYKAIPDPYLYNNLMFNWRIRPKDYLQPFEKDFGDYNVLLDGHSHTVYSDGKMEPEALLQWAIANGYNAIIVSDHNTLEGGLAVQKIAKEKYNDSIIVIPAMEYSSCRIHMNLIGINQTIDDLGHPFPTDQDLKDIIRRTHDLGGLVSVNHIPWSNKTEFWYQVGTLPDHPSREELLEWGIDAFEIINGDTFDLQTYLFAQQHNVSILTGSDVHLPSEAAYSWTTINTSDKTSPASILDEIRARRTSFLFDAQGTRPRVYPTDNPVYYRVLPIAILADYWSSFYTESKGMYSFQNSFCHEYRFKSHKQSYYFFILWCLFFFVCYEIGKVIVQRTVKWGRKIWKQRKERRGLDVGLIGMD